MPDLLAIACIIFISACLCIYFFLQNTRLQKLVTRLQADLDARPNSLELDEFLSDLARHGHGALRVQALRVDEILLRARPKL